MAYISVSSQQFATNFSLYFLFSEHYNKLGILLLDGIFYSRKNFSFNLDYSSARSALDMIPLKKYFIRILICWRYCCYFTQTILEVNLPEKKAHFQTSSILLAQAATMHTLRRLETFERSSPSSGGRNITENLFILCREKIVGGPYACLLYIVQFALSLIRPFCVILQAYICTENNKMHLTGTHYDILLNSQIMRSPINDTFTSYS
jgi:hypothetical protein